MKTIVSIILLMVYYNLSAQLGCSELLKDGVYEKSFYLKEINWENVTKSFLSNYYSKSNYNRSNLGFEIMTKLGITHGNNAMNSAISSYIKHGYDINKLSSSSQQEIRKVSKVLVNAFLQCRQTSGVRAILTRLPNSNRVNLVLSKRGIDFKVTIKKIRYSEGLEPIDPNEVKNIEVGEVEQPITFLIKNPSKLSNGIAEFEIVGSNVAVVGGPLRNAAIIRPKLYLFKYTVTSGKSVYNHEMAIIRDIKGKIHEAYITKLDGGNLNNTNQLATQNLSNDLIFEWETWRTNSTYKSKSTLSFNNKNWGGFKGKGQNVGGASFSIIGSRFKIIEL